ncbi:unnamed protein product [Didymodactylos carnosus]|uniref:SH3 domain-containing protein n=1 Tax=Didymodactylos carnosus TaxID=1234261 RepID=A0A8S2D042_9BILA|nr:unnamed protein product [Didymodactylos carnosus]CAF3631616.1 unnamed protein product [Didymodactylos carnosus]
MSITTTPLNLILVNSRSNDHLNDDDDDIEPYHISTFRVIRSSSVPPTPPSINKIRSVRKNDHRHSVMIYNHPQHHHENYLLVSKYRREKDEALTNKLYKLNMHTMRKKSARISMRLSSAFGLTSHTIDERFNYEEARFRAIDKFIRIFVRNAYTCMECLKDAFVAQVDVAEDFEELLNDKVPDLVQQFVRTKRSLLENAFTEFCTNVEICVANPLNTLIKLFVLPTSLISKRHDKLLDYDSAQSAYEKLKDQQSRQAKQVLDLAKKTYEALNCQLLEELPILYEHSSHIVWICLKAFICGHLRLMQHMRAGINIILTQTTSPAALLSSSATSAQLSWLQIVERFTTKSNEAAEMLFHLTSTAKNFSEKLKSLSSSRANSIVINGPMSPASGNVYDSDKEIPVQNDETRRLVRNRYLERDLYTVIRNYVASRTNSMELSVHSGDLVGVIKQNDSDPQTWFVDNGFARGFLPKNLLISITSSGSSGLVCRTPPTPLRNDVISSPSVSLPSANQSLKNRFINPAFSFDQTSSSDNTNRKLIRSDTEPTRSLINTTFDSLQSSQRESIYLNEPNVSDQLSTISHEQHQYASIDFEDSFESPPQTLNQQNQSKSNQNQNDHTQIYVALYDFQYKSDGVLSLNVGDRMLVLRTVDDGGNKDWWYVEKLNDEKQRGYVPANYIQSASS